MILVRINHVISSMNNVKVLLHLDHRQQVHNKLKIHEKDNNMSFKFGSKFKIVFTSNNLF